MSNISVTRYTEQKYKKNNFAKYWNMYSMLIFSSVPVFEMWFYVV